MTTRTAALVPHYHQVLPRCDVITLKQEQCIFSARWTDTKGRGLHLCTMHARLADFPVKQLRPKQVVL